MLLELAWKNMWRNPTRSLVIIAATTVGLTGGVVAAALMYGMADQMITSAIETRLSHLQIHHPDFLVEHTVDLVIPQADSIVTYADNMPEVIGVSPRVVVRGMASSAKTAGGINLLGVEPSRESTASSVPSSIVKGGFLGTRRRDHVRDPIVIGTELAEKLELQTGSKLVVTFQDAGGQITGAAFTITGLYETVSSRFDETHAYVRAATVRRLLGLSGGYHEIALRLSDASDVKLVEEKLQSRFRGIVADSWKDMAPDLRYMSEMMNSMLFIFLAVILAALAFGIVNTMLMAVLERTRELGMLLAVGMHRRLVFMMILLETLALSITGGILGMVCSGALVALLDNIGIDLSLFSKGLRVFGISEVIYPSVPVELYPMLMALVVVTALLSAIYPSIKALRLRPAAALRTAA
ncbi:MAG: FtsX-like permease family protein [Chitinivibrionales bacterium]|nr:FtsX-like permease family protein [Chitinivibrionales bacterium]MBD3397445.1 FtsX-like permease family protein [Chitinivibrionales bacterium]